MATRQNKSLTIRMFIVIAMSAGMVVNNAAAEDTSWNAATGDWFNPGNWLYKVPESGDSAYIYNGGTAEISGGSPEADWLYIGCYFCTKGDVNQSGGTATFDYIDMIYDGQYSLSGTGELNFGELDMKYLAIFNQSGSSSIVGYAFDLRNEAMFTQNGGANAFALLMMNSGGVFDHSGGTNNIATLSVGRDGSNNQLPIYYLSDTAQLNSDTQTVAGNSLISQSGGSNFTGSLIVGKEYRYGTYNQSGGVNHIDGTLVLGKNIGDEGEYIISGGVLNTREMQIGYQGTGDFEINDSNVSITVFDRLFFGLNSTFTTQPGSTIHMIGAAFDNWNTDQHDLLGLNNLSLIFEGGIAAGMGTLEVAGRDLGFVGTGFYENFALDALIIGGADIGRVQLVDWRDNVPGSEALYVKKLVLGIGSYLDLNGVNLYYQIFVDNGGTIDLNGGQLLGQVPDPATLTINVEPNDAGIDTISPTIGEYPTYVNWGVELQAEPYTSCPRTYNFDHWEGDVASPNSPSTYVIMDTDKTVTAVFVPVEPVCGDECHPILQGDLNKDCYINFEDFALYCEMWLACTHPDCD